MITDEELARTADRLRDGLGAAAAMMIADVSALARARRRFPGWLIPLTAAACVVALVAASVGIARSFSSTGNVQGPAAGPPPFYVTLSPDSLQVHSTRTGQVTAVTPAIPGSWQLDHVAAAADHRTFFATVNRITRGSCPSGPTSRFYRLTITATGRISGFASVAALDVTPLTISVSPDGSRIAYTVQGWRKGLGASNRVVCVPAPAFGVIDVMDLASGAVRSWRNTVAAAVTARVVGIPGPLTWMQDGRTLVVEYATAIGPFPPNLAVLGLDTSSTGGSLQAHSRVLWSQNGSCAFCVGQVLSGPGGSLTAVGWRERGTVYQAEVLRLGGPVLITVSRKSSRPTGWPTLYADASGQYIVVAWMSECLGWIKDGKLIPLPDAPVIKDGFAW
jgi:hypothetical protein